MPATLRSSPDGSGLRVAVLVAQWHAEVTARLEDAALRTLAETGVADDDVLVVEVPGAYELPQAAGWIARAGHADAIVALGCVIRGETPHFDVVAGACARGLTQVALETGVPVALGVITADTAAQAEARSGAGTGKGGNKGSEAADAAVRMGALYRSLEARRRAP
jgi:6,7-dimethyl-8-ribityllumazine synthase